MTSLQALSVVEADTAKAQDRNTFSLLLSSLLTLASYPPELQQQYFAFFTTHILPNLK
jgi:hypothetical protein